MNRRSVFLHEAALSDLEEGKAFYEGLETGVGSYFRDSLIADLESLKFFAGIHAKHFGFYRMLAKRFPFAIYYDITDTEVTVYAVLDMRREPSWNRENLSKRHQ